LPVGPSAQGKTIRQRSLSDRGTFWRRPLTFQKTLLQLAQDNGISHPATLNRHRDLF
jgi:hypothetical protein